MTKSRKDLQAIRGVAILCVLVFHIFPKATPNGYLGVDIFFVMSGFLVTPLIEKSLRPLRERGNLRYAIGNLKSFYRRRFYRLIPTLGATVSITIIIAVSFAPANHLESSIRQSFFSLIFLGNLGAYLISTDYFASSSNPLVHTWSLGVEEQFYVLAPFILIAISKLRKYQQRLIVVSASAISLLLFIFPNLLTLITQKIGIFPVASSLSFYSPTSRIWEFAAGAFISTRCKDEAKFPINRTFSSLLVLALALIIFWPTDLNHTTVAAAVIVLTCIIINSRSFESIPDVWLRTLAYFGDRSYTIYLMHLPLIYLFTKCEPFVSHRGFLIPGLPLSWVLINKIYVNIENRYRISNSTISAVNSDTRFLKVSGKFIVAPLALCALLAIVVAGNFFNLAKISPVASWNLDKNCEQLTTRGPACEYRIKNSKGAIFLTGDSYAAMYSGVLGKIAKKNHLDLIVWTHHSCNFVASTEVSKSDLCFGTTEKSIKLVKNKSPEYVFVSNFPYSKSKFNDVLRMLEKISTRGVKVFYIGPVPSLPQAPTEFKSLFWDFTSQTDVIARRKVHFGGASRESIVEFYNHLVQNNIGVIDPVDSLCDSSRCKVRQKERQFYLDPIHLTYSGSMQIFDQFAKLFQTDPAM